MRKILFITLAIISLFAVLQGTPLDSSSAEDAFITQDTTQAGITESKDNKTEEKLETKQQENDSNEEEENENNDIPEKYARPSLFKKILEPEESREEPEPVPCTCGVFLSGQFKKGSKKQPKGLPVLTQEMDTPFMNNAVGNRQCTNKCLELIIKHLPKSNEIICATVDREHVYKERAYLFVKNHSDKWHGTNLSAGREFCCRDNVPYKCP
ncbi:unnamed protein product, partial [Phyllotreta striolata]